MEFLDEFIVACLDEGVVEFLDKDNKDNLDVDIRNIFDYYFGYFLWENPLE